MNTFYLIAMLALAGYGTYYAFTLGQATSFIYQEMMRRGAFTQGYISRIRQQLEEGETRMYPTIIYEVNGTKYEQEPHVMTDNDQFRVGQSLELYYLNESPETCSWIDPKCLDERSLYYYCLAVVLLIITIRVLKVLFVLVFSH